ncbi:MAG: phosphatase PAP2 family protein [Acidobacteria bacterium]|nr:phosphatase PAP2 family protein [Acidobacteriota bacterium]
MFRNLKLILTALALSALSLSVVVWPQGGGRNQEPNRQENALGPRLKPAQQLPPLLRRPPALGTDTLARLEHWNELAINAAGLDHTPVAIGEQHVFGEQLGPGRSSRAMAIVHIAIFDAMNAVAGGYRSYTGVIAPRGAISIDAAIAKAACETLAALYPSQAASFNTALTTDLAQLADSPAKANGVELGRRAAAAILALRANDGSQYTEQRVGVDFITSNDPGKWRQDPISQIPLALGAKWGAVKPFVMRSGAQFRIAPPPALSSAEYAAAFNEVKRLGGDGITTPTQRTADQTEAGIYWAYDGTPSLCAPPRLYNQIAVQIAEQMGANAMEMARLLALVNVAMADAGIAAWESKYFYQIWRPITGIREADAGTGPTGLGDGNAATQGDVAFSPLGAPASNLTGPNFTPPFPAYPSGHAVFGAALFETLRDFFRTDNIAFTFVSDEYNGVTRDNQGVVRLLKPRSFTTLSQAEEENGQSRVYLGIHWSFDKTAGIAQGRRVADFVRENVFVPLGQRR